MKQDRGPIANKWAGVGNTWLFVGVLALMFYKIYTEEYMFALCVAAGGIYSELWNYRKSTREDYSEQEDEQEGGDEGMNPE